MTVGAASGLNVIFKTLLNPGDEVIAFSPYFVEYNAYVTNYEGVLKEVSCPAPGFLPNPEKLGMQLFHICQNITEIRLSDILLVNHYPFRVKESDTW